MAAPGVVFRLAATGGWVGQCRGVVLVMASSGERRCRPVGRGALVATCPRDHQIRRREPTSVLQPTPRHTSRHTHAEMTVSSARISMHRPAYSLPLGSILSAITAHIFHCLVGNQIADSAREPKREGLIKNPPRTFRDGLSSHERCPLSTVPHPGGLPFAGRNRLANRTTSVSFLGANRGPRTSAASAAQPRCPRLFAAPAVYSLRQWHDRKHFFATRELGGGGLASKQR